MKNKIILIAIVTLFLFGCQKQTKDIINTPAIDNYIEVIPNEAKEWIKDIDNELLMNNEEINIYNNNMIRDNLFLADLNEYTNEQKGIINNRCILRNKPNFENTIETGLYIGMPVVILEEKDNWYYIQTYFYKGWIEKDNVALANEEEWKTFISPNQFIIITESFFSYENKIIDMGSKLPYLGIKDDKYRVLIPYKDENNNLIYKEILIERKSAHIGYLPYNKRNLFIQAFKYLGTSYGWGDNNNGIDCSSFIANIHRTFGIYLPRNSDQQNTAIYNKISTNGLSVNDKYNKLSSITSPAIIYMKGHIMLYLGTKNNNHYIIHANGKTKNVAYEILPYIDKIETINIIP